jgi:hypothetical protein
MAQKKIRRFSQILTVKIDFLERPNNKRLTKAGITKVTKGNTVITVSGSDNLNT